MRVHDQLGKALKLVRLLRCQGGVCVDDEGQVVSAFGDSGPQQVDAAFERLRPRCAAVLGLVVVAGGMERLRAENEQDAGRVMRTAKGASCLRCARQNGAEGGSFREKARARAPSSCTPLFNQKRN